MIHLCLDPIILGIILYFVVKVEADDFPKIFLVSIAVGIANIILVFLLGEKLGLFILVPILIVDGAIITYFYSMTLTRAVITVSVFMVYQIVFEIIMFLLLKS